MRGATCAPILGLLSVAVFAQTSPDCIDTVNWTLIYRSMPAMASGIVTGPGVRPLPECALCARFSQASTARPGGANRTPIYRAIRALGSRIFPGNLLGRQPRTGRTLLDRSWRGMDFRFVLGKEVVAGRPCPAPLMQVH